MGRKDPDNGVILLVVDDAALRSSLEFILRVEGYKVRTYACGRELLEDADLSSGSCLVVDQRLPDDGLHLIDAMRCRNVRLPAILIATHPTRALRHRAEAARIPIVEKPLITGTLFQRIGAAVR